MLYSELEPCKVCGKTLVVWRHWNGAFSHVAGQVTLGDPYIACTPCQREYREAQQTLRALE